MLLVPVLFLLLFLGQEFKAKTAILSCCNSTTSLTQPLITTADQLFSIARLAKLSPSKATFSDAFPSTNKTLDCPGSDKMLLTKELSSSHFNVTTSPEKLLIAPKLLKFKRKGRLGY
mgnify:CR=1 FL=1